jgi:hypothetical protein
MKKTRQENQRKGIVVPLVISSLTLLFILILVLSRGSSDAYRQTALIHHRTHARFMGMAAIEEGHDVLWNLLSNPLKAGKERVELLGSVLGGGEFEIDLLPKLKYSKTLEQGQKKSNTSKDSPITALYEASARFHDFRLIRYSAGEAYRTPTAFYTSPDGEAGGKASAGEQGTHPDFFGFVTFTVKAQHGIVTKTIQETRPVKIVDMTPMGKEYAVFEMEPSQSQSLNEGEGFYVEGNDEGRIRMIGPYLLDVEGKPDGEAMGWMQWQDSVGGYSYPGWAGDKWYDDAFVPSPKGLSTCPFFGTNGGRPAMKSGGSVAVTPYIPLPCCPNLLALPVDYVAQFANPASQEWVSGTLEKDTQNFSLQGVDGDVHFKGLLYQRAGKYEEAMGITEDWDPEKEEEIRHEGVIIGNYQTHKIRTIRVTFPIQAWAVTLYICVYTWFGGEGSPVQDIYALKGDEEPEIDWAGVVIGGLLDVAGGLSAAGSAGWAAGGMQAVGVAAKSVGQQLVAQAVLNPQGTTVGDGTSLNPDTIPNTFPSGFRMIHRAAVRRFATLDEALWKKRKLLLDGVFWIDDLNTNKDIKYIGKGTLASFGGEMAPAPSIRILEPQKEDRDFLNLWYLNAAEGSAIKVDAPYLMASVYSLSSIQPQQSLVLVGNLMTSRVRKEDLTQDLAVSYWNAKLSDPSQEDYQKDYRVISLSPKIEAHSEVALNLKAGIGDDGVEVIIDSIGE